MPQPIRHDQTAPAPIRLGAKAVAATRAGANVAAFSTLILSLLLVLLFGAVWTQLT